MSEKGLFWAGRQGLLDPSRGGFTPDVIDRGWLRNVEEASAGTSVERGRAGFVAWSRLEPPGPAGSYQPVPLEELVDAGLLQRGQQVSFYNENTGRYTTLNAGQVEELQRQLLNQMVVDYWLAARQKQNRTGCPVQRRPQR